MINQEFTYEVTAEHGTVVQPGRHAKPENCLEYAIFTATQIPLADLPEAIQYGPRPQSGIPDTRIAVNIRSEKGHFLAQAVHETLINLTVAWWPLGWKTDAHRRLPSMTFEDALRQIIADAADRLD